MEVACAHQQEAQEFVRWLSGRMLPRPYWLPHLPCVVDSKIDSPLAKERAAARTRAKAVAAAAAEETRAEGAVKIRIGRMRSGGITGGELHHHGSDSTHQMRLPWQSP